MAKHKHMTLQERYDIQHSLNAGESFKQIASKIEKDPSTISKEIRSHYTIVKSGGYGKPFNPCLHRKTCMRSDLCPDKACKLSRCASCNGCYTRCSDFVEEHCPQLDRPPYVCNGYSRRPRCTLRKQLYAALSADKEYQTLRSESRQGISLTPEEIARLDDIISPLIKQGQSIHHICFNNADVIMVDEKTIYNYVNLGLFSVGNIHLPRKVRYRPRGKTKSVKLDKRCYAGRTYQDFLSYLEANPDTSVVEMDSVEGEKGGKVLLTKSFRGLQFMLAFIREANTARSVTEIIDDLYVRLGTDTFCTLFPVILADRGSEFSNPLAIEFDSDGNRRTHVFYCDPKAPHQKGSLEVAHEMIRRVIPKGTSLNRFEQEDIELMMNHINSYARKILNNRSANQLFSFFHGEDVLAKLGAHHIEPNSIILTPNLLKK